MAVPVWKGDLEFTVLYSWCCPVRTAEEGGNSHTKALGKPNNYDVKPSLNSLTFVSLIYLIFIRYHCIVFWSWRGFSFSKLKNLFLFFFSLLQKGCLKIVKFYKILNSKEINYF